MNITFRTDPMTMLASVLVALTLAAWSGPATTLESRRAESPPSVGIDHEVRALVQELRDLPGDVSARVCTPCNEVSKVGGQRRCEIYDRLNALGTVAVPALARMLQGSLQGSNKDLTSTILWILGKVHGPYSSRDGKQHEKNVSAALPVLILALNDDPKVGGLAARMLIGAIGPPWIPRDGMSSEVLRALESARNRLSSSR
jgi:hypothetical protein